MADNARRPIMSTQPTQHFPAVNKRPRYSRYRSTERRNFFYQSRVSRLLIDRSIRKTRQQIFTRIRCNPDVPVARARETENLTADEIAIRRDVKIRYSVFDETKQLIDLCVRHVSLMGI